MYLRERKASALAPPFQTKGRLLLAVNHNPIVLSVRREEYFSRAFWRGQRVLSLFAVCAHFMVKTIGPTVQ